MPREIRHEALKFNPGTNSNFSQPFRLHTHFYQLNNPYSKKKQYKFASIIHTQILITIIFILIINQSSHLFSPFRTNQNQPLFNGFSHRLRNAKTRQKPPDRGQMNYRHRAGDFREIMLESLRFCRAHKEVKFQCLLRCDRRGRLCANLRLGRRFANPTPISTMRLTIRRNRKTAYLRRCSR